MGVRSTVVARDPRGAEAVGVTSSVPSAANRVLGIVCFVLVVAAVALALMVIIATGLGKQVSFEHVFPTLVPKS